MNSPLERASKLRSESENTNDMSPVTDLALNLKSLTTTLTGTPSRRISWSDPSPNRVTCIGEFSPSTDSPMFQEILMKIPTKVLPRKTGSLNCGDKENVPPEVERRSESTASSENDSVNVSDSQDSGYISTCARRMSSLTPGSTPRVRVKSSVFANMTNDEFDGDLFLLDEDIDMDTVSGVNMKSLLTKPLCNVGAPTDITVRKGKLPTRRCLTLEMENSDSSPMKLDLASKSNSQTVITDMHYNTSTDLQPLKKHPFKRPDPCSDFLLHSKRRKSSPTINVSEEDISTMDNFMKQRSFSETAATIMHAVQISDSKPDLIGDCSRFYALPVVRGRHQDLKCISADTLAHLIRGEYAHSIDSYTLVDCRYPYEFEAGHIVGAENIYTKEEILKIFLENGPKQASKKHVIIFHCEFSSERAPNLCRFLRNKDREINECSYPKLHHPEIYLLEGGYKTFFANFLEFCEPQGYKPMNHKDHGSDLRLFRAKSKSWGSDSKQWFKMKSSTSSDNV